MQADEHQRGSQSRAHRQDETAPVSAPCISLPDAGAARTATDSLGRLGSLEVRLARDEAEVRAAQALRYRVFFCEMAATADRSARMAGLDADGFDAACDHLLVLDHAATADADSDKPAIVGTYRLLTDEAAARHDGFYSQSEYRIDAMVARHADRRFLELGRSCVSLPYRTKRTVELLWQGIWAYVRRHGIDVMFGCASFSGTDPDALALPLSFLHHRALAPQPWRVRAQPGLFCSMARLPSEAIEDRAAIRALPPLIKGYLRLGARVGEGAVIDYRFGTTDILIILPVEAINGRYIGHYGYDAGRYAR